MKFKMRLMVFPLGRHFAPPSDKLGHDVAQLLLSPSDNRDRLTQGMYLPLSTNEQLGRIEDALVKVIKAEPIEKRIKKELTDYQADYHGLDGMLTAALERKIITDEEADLIVDMVCDLIENHV